MVIFVTGGTGFIGSHLVDALLLDPRITEVRCMVRSDLKWLSGKRITPISASLSDLNKLEEALQGVDTVYHLAGMVMAPTYESLHKVNVDGTESLLLMAQKCGVKRVIVASSLAAVGPSNGKALDETDAFSPVSNYGRSKKNMEIMISALKLSMPVTIIRPPAVFGPREDQILSFFKSAAKGFAPIVGDGNNPLVSMVYVKDLIEGFLVAAKEDSPGIRTYFITGQRDYSWNEIVEATSLALSKKVRIVKLKAEWVQKAGTIAENVLKPFGIYPVVNKEKAQELVLEWRCSSKKAQNELAYSAKYSLSNAIAETVDWYKRHHWI
jgi:nucleoside-diphosphate-sugar epimerase